METIKLKARIHPDTTLEWLEPFPYLPTGEVEVIVLYSAQPTHAQLPTMEWSSKKDLEYWFERLCETLHITGIPMGIEELQRIMGTAGLEENELSRDLIAMRDE